MGAEYFEFFTESYSMDLKRKYGNIRRYLYFFVLLLCQNKGTYSLFKDRLGHRFSLLALSSGTLKKLFTVNAIVGKKWSLSLIQINYLRFCLLSNCCSFTQVGSIERRHWSKDYRFDDRKHLWRIILPYIPKSGCPYQRLFLSLIPLLLRGYLCSWELIWPSGTITTCFFYRWCCAKFRIFYIWMWISARCFWESWGSFF